MNEGPSIIPGTWHSVREQEGGGRGVPPAHDQSVDLRWEGRLLIIESRPTRLRAELDIRHRDDRSVATGSWREDVDPDGKSGAQYVGTAMLIIAKDNRSMAGKWMGGDSAIPEVHQGEWTLTQGWDPEKRMPVDGWNGGDGFPVPI